MFFLYNTNDSENAPRVTFEDFNVLQTKIQDFG